jgi:hypothetical protein
MLLWIMHLACPAACRRARRRRLERASARRGARPPAALVVPDSLHRMAPRRPCVYQFTAAGRAVACGRLVGRTRTRAVPRYPSCHLACGRHAGVTGRCVPWKEDLVLSAPQPQRLHAGSKDVGHAYFPFSSASRDRRRCRIWYLNLSFSASALSASSARDSTSLAAVTSWPRSLFRSTRVRARTDTAAAPFTQPPSPTTTDPPAAFSRLSTRCASSDSAT